MRVGFDCFALAAVLTLTIVHSVRLRPQWPAGGISSFFSFCSNLKRVFLTIGPTRAPVVQFISFTVTVKKKSADRLVKHFSGRTGIESMCGGEASAVEERCMREAKVLCLYLVSHHRLENLS